MSLKPVFHPLPHASRGVEPRLVSRAARRLTAEQQQPDASGVIQMAMMPADQAQLDLDGFLDESVWQQVPATDASGNGTYGYY
jgi:chromosomal replication initiation ATPase DnaA